MGSRRAIVALFLVAFLIGAANLIFTAHYVNSQQAAARQQGQVIEQKLCVSFERLASLNPPAGNPETNPSRGYLQQQHLRLDELGTDLGCRESH